MAARKKTTKKTTKKTAAPKPVAKRKAKAAKTAAKTDKGGVRGRKPVLVGCTSEQGKRLRRALRAAGVALSQMEPGSVKVTEKGGKVSCKIGKQTFTLDA